MGAHTVSDHVLDVEERLRAAVLDYTRGQPAVVTVTWQDPGGGLSHWFEKVIDVEGLRFDD